ncbi:hypothetical protein PHET_00835 [Paragonimus heterotremus]|uniref:Uncharacterized protein n=1 Tax=Paragonimus heterotremus TaxID=100268 RepID=A0A8J4TS88_9TREM|nr:hypothetical protein PHET_00835 [Paragonimus heterotremus]
MVSHFYPPKQVCRCSLLSIHLFSNCLSSSGLGHLWDSQSDPLLHALIARAGGDNSTKFLQKESMECLFMVIFCLTTERAISSLCSQILANKVKSSHGRLVVGKLLANLMDRLETNEDALQCLPQKLGVDSFEKFLKVTAQLLADGLSETRTCGRKIFSVLSRIHEIGKMCKRALTDRQLQNMQPLCVKNKT